MSARIVIHSPRGSSMPRSKATVRNPEKAPKKAKVPRAPKHVEVEVTNHPDGRIEARITNGRLRRGVA